MKKALTVLVSIFMTVAILASCAAPAATPATTPTAPASQTPKTGGVLRMAIPNAPSVMDAFKSGPNSPGTIGVNRLVYEHLVTWAGKDDLEAIQVGRMLKSWEYDADGLGVTYHIREGIRYQNLPPMNGREFTAEDVKYHYDRVMNPDNKHQLRVSWDLKSIDVIDKYTVHIRTNTKTINLITLNQTDILYPKEIVEAPGGAEKNWVGTGAFMLTEYVPNVKAVYKKNPDYWQKGHPYLDGVEVYFMSDEAARVAAFRAGEIDVLPQENKANLDRVKSSTPGAVVTGNIGLIDTGLTFNLKKEGPLQNKKVRQAIQYALDYDGIIQAALDGAGMRTDYLGPMFAEWGALPADKLPKRDIAKAKALMKEAGYPDGFKTTILQNAGRMDVYGYACEPVVAMLKEIGINATIVPADGAQFISKWRASDFDMTIAFLPMIRPYKDPDNSLSQQWTTKSSYNFYGISNPKLDELIPKQKALFPDTEKRKPIVKEILEILREEVYAVPLYISYKYYIKQPYVQGLEEIADVQTYYGMMHLQNAWLNK